MKTVLLGTRNRSKFEVYKDLVSKDDINLVDMSVFDNAPEIIEDHKDIVGNSIKKSTTLAKFSNLPTLSDDTGVFIDALGGSPGVSVRRWQGELPDDISDEDWVKYFLNKIEKIPKNELKAQKVTVVSLALPTGEVESVKIVIDGRIVVRDPTPTYTKGGPFSAYFFQEEFGKFESELTEEEKQRHFGDLKKAVSHLLEKLN